MKGRSRSPRAAMHNCALAHWIIITHIVVVTPAVAEPNAPEDDAARALERALVSTGALLLPRGQIELAPSLFYIRSERRTPTLFSGVGGQFIAEQEVQSDIVDAALQLRLGLPADTQLEFELPYRHVSEERSTSVLFQPLATTEMDESGVGDISVGVAKTLARERGWRPNLIARLTWDTDTGDAGSGGAGYGYHEVRVALTGTQRQDPLVFLWTLSYQKAFEQDGVTPGDEVGVALGALLAASPETSLRVILDQRFGDDVEIAGVTQAGSGDTVGTLTFGASSIIGAGQFLDFAVQTGLTEDAPDYAVGVTLTVRFDAFGA